MLWFNMHKTEILNSQITFMERLKYFKCSLSITTSFSQVFIFFYRKKFLLLPFFTTTSSVNLAHDLIATVEITRFYRCIQSQRWGGECGMIVYIGETLWKIDCIFHFLGPPLWSRGKVVVSHPVDPGSIPLRVSFQVGDFFRVFPQL